MIKKPVSEPMRDLSIALFMSDTLATKSVSHAVRETGHFSEYYQNLRDLWTGVQLNLPHLLFIDIADCMDSEVPFYRHPLVTKGDLKFVLLYRVDTALLVHQSHWAKQAYAVLNIDENLALQASLIIERRKNELELQRDLKKSQDGFQKIQTKSMKLFQEKSEADFFKQSYKTALELAQDVESYSQGGDFLAAVARKLSEWNKIEQVGFYILSPNGQRLQAPQYQRAKYIMLPGLYLGQECLEGILPFAQEMAYQVVNELYEIEPIEMKLCGSHGNPDILIYLQVENNFKNEFKWEILEQELETIYRKTQLAKKDAPLKSFLIESQEALDRMDEIYFHQNESKEKVFVINFNPLINFIKSKSSSKFYYTAFYRDFLLATKSSLQESSVISQMGPWNVVVFSRSHLIEKEFSAVRMAIKTFSYWKYFEDETKLIIQEVHPTVKHINASALQYFNFVEREFEMDEVDLLLSPKAKESISSRFSV